MTETEPIPEATIAPPDTPPDTPIDAPPATAGARPGAAAAFVAAVRFLTRVPLTFAAPTTTAAFQASPVFFPLVGLLIGSFTAGVAGAASLVWPVWLAVAAALAAEARLTGAFHEDALADFCDAFGGGWTREQTLTILDDSRIGAYGALGLFFGVTLRWGATAAVVGRLGLTNWAAWISAVVAAAAVSRWVIVLSMAILAPVSRRSSLCSDIGGRTTPRQVLVSFVSILPAVVAFAVFMPMQCLVALFAVAATLLWFLRYVNRRLGGVTGDCLGCIGYITQVIVLLAAAARIEQ